MPIRVHYEGRRYYRISRDPIIWAPSVTTILGATAPARDKAVLENWALRNPGAKEAAAERGTAIHKACEDYIRGRPVIVAPEYQGFWDGMARHLDTFDGFIWSERPLLPQHRHLIDAESGLAMVHSLKYRFAGTPDLIGLRGGSHVLVDFKTSNGPYSRFFPNEENVDHGATFGGWSKYVKCATQMAAYRIAIKETLGIDCPRCQILVSTPDITQSFQIHGPELRRYEVRWLQKIQKFYDENHVPSDLEKHALLEAAA